MFIAKENFTENKDGRVNINILRDIYK